MHHIIKTLILSAIVFFLIITPRVSCSDTLDEITLQQQAPPTKKTERLALDFVVWEGIKLSIGLSEGA